VNWTSGRLRHKHSRPSFGERRVQTLQAELMALRSAFGCLAQCLQEQGVLDTKDLVDRIQASASLHVDERLRTALEQVAEAVMVECDMSGRPARAPGPPALRLVGEE